MPRDDVSAYTATEIAKSSVQPLYFLRIGWDTGGGVDYLRNSSSVDIMAGANNYLGNGLMVGSGSANELGNAYRVILPDEDHTVRGYIDTQGLGVRARIFQAWIDTRAFPSTWDLGLNSIRILDGVVVGVPEIGLTVTLECEPDIRSRQIPHIICGKPTNRWNVPPGTVVRGFFAEIEVVE